MIANSNFCGTSLVFFLICWKLLNEVGESQKNTCHSCFPSKKDTVHSDTGKTPELSHGCQIHCLCGRTQRRDPSLTQMRHLMSQRAKESFFGQYYLLWRGFAQTLFFWSTPWMKQISEFDIVSHRWQWWPFCISMQDFPIFSKKKTQWKQANALQSYKRRKGKATLDYF